jgi:hypothetical protein
MSGHDRGGADMGRKKMKAGAKVDVRLRMDGDLARRIHEAAESEGNSVAAFIRSAVVKELARRQREIDEK